MKYLNHVREELNKLTLQSQALAWFIAFKLSGLLLSNLENVGISSFLFVIQFLMSVIFITIGVCISDIILKNRNTDQNNNNL